MQKSLLHVHYVRVVTDITARVLKITVVKREKRKGLGVENMRHKLELQTNLKLRGTQKTQLLRCSGNVAVR